MGIEWWAVFSMAMAFPMKGMDMYEVKLMGNLILCDTEISWRMFNQ